MDQQCADIAVYFYYLSTFFASVIVIFNLWELPKILDLFIKRFDRIEEKLGIIEDGKNENGDDDEKLDKLLFEVAKWAIECGKGLSTSAVQRHFNVGYSRAGKIVDQLYGLGICSRSTGNSKPRAMLVDMESLKNLFERLNRNENGPGKTEGL